MNTGRDRVTSTVSRAECESLGGADALRLAVPSGPGREILDEGSDVLCRAGTVGHCVGRSSVSLRTPQAYRASVHTGRSVMRAFL